MHEQSRGEDGAREVEVVEGSIGGECDGGVGGVEVVVGNVEGGRRGWWRGRDRRGQEW